MALDNRLNNQRTQNEVENTARLAQLFESSAIPTHAKLQGFPAWTKRQDISRFLARYELFKEVLNVNGSIVECGVFAGGGAYSWYHFSSILEPYNHSRRIFGFDTFEGFPGVTDEDLKGENVYKEVAKIGGLNIDKNVLEDLNGLKLVHDQNRPIGHIEKISFIKGDASQTIKEFVQNRPELLISLLYIDFDIYSPSKTALENLLPLVPRGGIVAFDELNHPGYPGETVALKQVMKSLPELKRSPLDPYISWFKK